MKCHLCEEDKLSKEFPFYPLTDNCNNHPLLHCLDCSISSVKNDKKCSQCGIFVDENNKRYEQYLKTLKFLFPNEEDEVDDSIFEMDIVEGDIRVITLSGVLETFEYQPQKKICHLKGEIENKFKTPPDKQRLLYNDQELKVKNEDEEMTLEDFNIPPNSTLQLIIKLCDVPDDLEEIVFDFCWGLPRKNQVDYLDVSVFVFSGKSYDGTIYWRNRSISGCPGMIHSGPADMDHTKGRGRHRVDISLKSVPQRIDKFVFTLSAWRSSSVSAYPFRRLRFYDVNSPDVELCSDDMNDVLHNESIIMCYLSKKDGPWSVTSLKCGAEGDTKSFRWGNSKLQEKIQDLIQSGIIN